MPVYEFRCPVCTTVFEEKRSFARADDPTRCPACGSDRAAKVFAAAMVFSPGSAAKAMLEPKPARNAPASHAAGCPCCGGRSK